MVCSGYQNSLANRPLMTLPTVNVILNEIEEQGQAKKKEEEKLTRTIHVYIQRVGK